MRSVLAVAADDGISDDDWLPAVLMTVSGKPAAEWSDQDADMFDVTIRDVVHRLRRLEALFYHQLAVSDGDSFESVRLTVTQPSGDERSAIVSVDADTRVALASTVSDTLTAVEMAGPQARLSFLALVAEAVLPRVDSDPKEPEVEFATRRRVSRNGSV